MKTLLIGVNAKYIHPNLAIRLLKVNCDYDCDIIEFTIKDKKEDIINYILSNNYEVIGFSCYIWNIEFIKEILKELIPYKKTIFLGGPEVSYNAKYYLKNNLAKYVIKNEGEEAFNKLMHYLNNENPKIEEIPNLYYQDKFTFDKLVDIKNIKLAYDLLDDVTNKIVYIETSRGCPYHCGYCMASLDNKVRFFDIEEIKRQILLLQKRNARIFKFLDRTFNANKKNFINLIDFIIENHNPNNSFQFEITGDLLSPEIIDYINEKAPKNLFRFEIGIQSTNIKTNLSVGRIQDNAKLFANIRKIQDANIIDLHLDLIAGLPYEDYSSFENTFNEVVKLEPKELQLGFLKLLYGTRLMEDAIKYNYVWQDKAPYEVIQNDFISPTDIAEIHLAEDAFEAYYNSGIMKETMKLIIRNEVSPFEFFHQLGKTDYKRKPLEIQFKNLDSFILNKPNYETLHQTLIIDYLKYFKLKPKAWWNEKVSPKEKNQIFRTLLEKNKLNEPLEDLFKHSLLVSLKDIYLIAIYKTDLKLLKITK